MQVPSVVYTGKMDAASGGTCHAGRDGVVEGRVIRPGEVVRSRAGRDRGWDLMVLAVLDERHVLVADGRRRRVGKPKRKNVRHLDPRAGCAGLAARLVAGEAVSDEDVRQAISELTASEEAHD